MQIVKTEPVISRYSSSEGCVGGSRRCQQCDTEHFANYNRRGRRSGYGL